MVSSGMAKPLVTDELWAVIEPLLPPEPAKPKGGRPRVDNRAALTGVLFVLKSGIPWEMLPQEMGCGSGMTCWRRLRDWQDAGIWDQLHRTLLERLQAAEQIDWSRASLDSASVPAPGGARKPDRIRQIAARRARSSSRSAPPLVGVPTACGATGPKMPASCQSRKRRQQVMPEPQPISWGSISQGDAALEHEQDAG
jgi:transposase